MYKAEFEVEFITPAFIRGADQTKAELRASSIKGVMRWWFRALAGNYFGNNIEKLKEAENRAFGSTERRSDVVVEVIPKSPPQKLHFKPCTIDRNSDVAKLKYLWFSIELLSKEKSGCQFQWYYPPRSKFEVMIRSRTEKSFNVALASLWALINLGGLGFRFRKGAGSMKIIGGDLEKLEELRIPPKLSSVEDIKSGIKNCIRIIEQYARSEGYTQAKSLSEYPVLSSVYLSKDKFGTYFQALKDFEKQYIQFRRRCMSKPDRIVFGLPLRLKGKGTGKIRDILNLLPNIRRASPLLVGVVEINGAFYIRSSVLKSSKFHPDIPNNLVNWRYIYQFVSNYSTKIWQ